MIVYSNYDPNNSHTFDGFKDFVVVFSRLIASIVLPFLMVDAYKSFYSLIQFSNTVSSGGEITDIEKVVLDVFSFHNFFGYSLDSPYLYLFLVTGINLFIISFRNLKVREFMDVHKHLIIVTAFVSYIGLLLFRVFIGAGSLNSFFR